MQPTGQSVSDTEHRTSDGKPVMWLFLSTLYLILHLWEVKGNMVRLFYQNKCKDGIDLVPIQSSSGICELGDFSKLRKLHPVFPKRLVRCLSFSLFTQVPSPRSSSAYNARRDRRQLSVPGWLRRGSSDKRAAATQSFSVGAERLPHPQAKPTQPNANQRYSITFVFEKKAWGSVVWNDPGAKDSGHLQRSWQ